MTYVEHRYALIVGIDSYTEHEQFISLPFAQADARALYELLIDPERGGWSPEQVVYLDAASATRDELESQLRDLFLVKAQPDDCVLFYFAGHAFFDAATQDGYLALQSTQVARPVTGLHLPTFVDHYLYDSRAGQILTLLDVAHSAPGWQRHFTPGETERLFGSALRDLPRSKGRVILASERSTQVVREQLEQGHGPFMQALLDGLDGSAANPRTGRVTLGTLYDYLADQLLPSSSIALEKFGYEYGSLVLLEWAEWRSSPTVQPLARGRILAGVEVQPLHILVGHQGHADDVVFSPDGSLVASCGEDMSVRVWSTQSGALLHTLTGHSGAVMGVDISPDGRVLASCSEDKTIDLWSTQTGQLLRTLSGHHSAVWTVAFSLDDRYLASCSNDETVRLWNPHTGILEKKLHGHNNVVVGVDFSYDSKLLASCSFDRTIVIWDVESGELQRRLRYSDIVYGVAWSPDGNLLASCSADTTISLWDPHTGQVVQTLTGHEGAVWTVDFSADGRLLVSGSEDGSLKLWDVYQGREIQTLNHRFEVYGVVFGPNGLLANSAEDGAVRVWRTEVIES